MASKPLDGKHVLVTGAGTGIGRGIAVGFAELGAQIYATGRTEKSLIETTSLVKAVGGECVPLICDHSDDSAVQQLWHDLDHVDIVVNNAYSAVQFIFSTQSTSSGESIPSYKRNIENPKELAAEGCHPGPVWDLVNNVGLRNNYICSTYALRKFEAQGGGGVLINVSSLGGIFSVFDAAYCVGKSGVDRLSSEFAREAPEGVTCFTYYPGLVATDRLKAVIDNPDNVLHSWNSESPLFVGRSLARGLAYKDGKLIPSMHGRIVIAAELGRIVGATDENGYCPLSARSLRCLFGRIIPSGSVPLLNLIPNIYVPFPLLQILSGVIKVW